MKILGKKYWWMPFALALMLVPTACSEDETELGMGLEDPSTMFDGQKDTVYLEGWTIYDDSLLTSDYQTGLIGKCADAEMGVTKAIFYSQIALRDNNGINVAEGTVVDSVVLSLAINDIYPEGSSKGTHNLHFKIDQLSESMTDSVYYAFSELEANGTNFYDGTVTVSSEDSIIRLKMKSAINSYVDHSASAESFLEAIKGVRIELNKESGDEAVMVTANFAALNTKLTAYCSSPGDTVSTPYDFLIGYGTKHFVQFVHDYAGSSALGLFATESGKKDSIAGTTKLYLQPMGGTQLKLRLDATWFKNFRAKHPNAVIHYAELKLPVENGKADELAARVMAYQTTATGFHSYVADYSDYFTYRGFDGYFHEDYKSYRMRVTQHLQSMLRTGKDYGTTIAIDARRSSAKSAIINGTGSIDRPRIEIIYSE